MNIYDLKCEVHRSKYEANMLKLIKKYMNIPKHRTQTLNNYQSFVAVTHTDDNNAPKFTLTPENYFKVPYLVFHDCSSDFNYAFKIIGKMVRQLLPALNNKQDLTTFKIKDTNTADYFIKSVGRSFKIAPKPTSEKEIILKTQYAGEMLRYKTAFETSSCDINYKLNSILKNNGILDSTRCTQIIELIMCLKNEYVNYFLKGLLELIITTDPQIIFTNIENRLNIYETLDKVSHIFSKYPPLGYINIHKQTNHKFNITVHKIIELQPQLHVTQ